MIVQLFAKNMICQVGFRLLDHGRLKMQVYGVIGLVWHVAGRIVPTNDPPDDWFATFWPSKILCVWSAYLGPPVWSLGARYLKTIWICPRFLSLQRLVQCHFFLLIGRMIINGVFQYSDIGWSDRWGSSRTIMVTEYCEAFSSFLHIFFDTRSHLYG